MIAIWKATRTKTKSCVEIRILPAGLQNVSSLHLPRNKGTENTKAISAWAEHWSIGQSYPYCKERPFCERNPQLLSTATIATILNFILLRGLWSRSEPEEQFSDAKVSFHLKTTIFFGSKFLSLEWSLFFLDGARLKLINNPRKSNKFLGHENPNSQTPPASICVSNLLLANPTFGPFAGAPKEMGIEGPLLINSTTSSVESATGEGPVEVAVQKIGVTVLEAVAVGGGGRELDVSLCWIQEAMWDGWEKGPLVQRLYPWYPLILGMQLPGSISIHQDMPPRDEAARIP